MEFLLTLLFLIFIVPIVAIVAWMYVRILHRAGYSGWWAVLMFLPVVHLVMIWIFAFAEWPNLRKPPITIINP